MKTNKPVRRKIVLATEQDLASLPKTHAGGPAQWATPLAELRRLVLTCLLWENTYYKRGGDIVDRIKHLATHKDAGEPLIERTHKLAKGIPFAALANLAQEARKVFKLRHVPLLLLTILLRNHRGDRRLGDAIAHTIQRPDEMGELINLFWQQTVYPRGKGAPDRVKLPNQLKLALARCFGHFDEYQLTKYATRKAAVTLRDVMFLVRPKPVGKARIKLYKQIANETWKDAKTWEQGMLKGEEKKEVWEGLLQDGKLPHYALLANLRNMKQAGVDEQLVKEEICTASFRDILPYRFIAAAKHAPWAEDALDVAMCAQVESQPKLKGKTAILIDHSDSMRAVMSDKSEMSYFDAACALAMLARERCQASNVYAFSEVCKRIVPARRGFALREQITNSMGFGSTYMGAAIRHVMADFPGCDRLIVITDEQSHDRVTWPRGLKQGYILNVAPYQHGVGYGEWTTIHGWSPAVLEYITAREEAAL